MFRLLMAFMLAGPAPAVQGAGSHAWSAGFQIGKAAVGRAADPAAVRPRQCWGAVCWRNQIGEEIEVAAFDVVSGSSQIEGHAAHQGFDKSRLLIIAIQ